MTLQFDKFINVFFYEKVPTDNSLYSIVTPSTGRKPRISLSAEYFSSNTLVNIELKITNLSLDVPITKFKYVRIQAGYLKGQSTTMDCQILFAYMERPAPDSIMVFKILKGNWTNFNLFRYYGTGLKGTLLKDLVKKVCDAMEMTFIEDSSVLAGITLLKDENVAGLGKDCLHNILTAYSIDHDFSLGFLRCFDKKKGITPPTEVKLNYLSSPIQQEAGSSTIKAPWIPILEPYQVFSVDSNYVRQSFGGAIAANLVGVPVKFICISYKFNFSTVEDENSMTIFAQNSSISSTDQVAMELIKGFENSRIVSE